MKFNYLIKSIPFLSTLLISIFLCFSNQKEYTKLKILIWNTPSLALGSYLSISTGSGFILSYYLTTKLVEINQSKQKRSLKSKDENSSDAISDTVDSSNYAYYNNTLIERDIKDPLPTINASFRVIGKKDQITNNFIDNNIKYDESPEFIEQPDDDYEQNDNINTASSNNSDWYDQSFSSW